MIQIDPPIKWINGTKGNVILIHGLHERFIFLKKIGNLLNTKGFRVHVLKDIHTNVIPVRQSVLVLEQFVKSKDLQNIILVCHSKGGLVANYFFKTSKSANRVKKVITLATPYHGSLFAFPFDRDCVPNSEIIKLINSNSEDNQKIFNIYPRFDNHVIPNKNLILSGAHSYKIDIVGHTRILEAQQTLETISKII